ncbi:MAG: hypothetical protein JWP22_2415 [Ramlibacter sp.]|jgi:hypothetical protein|nr:hypothetical protein [Ramlibacter sp.]MDB5913740.1 hypothetical protein [Ramlibacter sp.]
MTITISLATEDRQEAGRLDGYAAGFYLAIMRKRL